MNPQSLKNLADAQFERATLLNNLKETALSQLTVVHNGGMFIASLELISFLNAWTENEVYVEDVYNNPILVKRVELLSSAKDSYSAAMATWHTEFQRAARIRRAANV